MYKPFALFTVLFFSIQQVYSKAIAAEVDLSKTSFEMPSAYLGATSVYHFNSPLKIDSVYLTNNRLCRIEKREGDLFHISHEYDSYVANHIEEKVHVIILLEGSVIREINLALLPPPSVKIDYRFDNKEFIFSALKDSLPVISNFTAHASFDYPYYVQGDHRYKGVFCVVIMKGEIELEKHFGWYDTGDRTRLIDLTHIGSGSEVELVIDRENMESYRYRNASGLGRGCVQLSDDTPKRLKCVIR
jgi:hypothetical protein